MSEITTQEEKVIYQKTANKLYKEYKSGGGTLSFKDFIQREKDKGVFPLNIDLNDEIQNTLNMYKQNKQQEMNNKIMGFPVKTLVIASSLILISLVAYKIIKNRQK